MVQFDYIGLAYAGLSLQDVDIELFRAFAVEGDASDFTFLFYFACTIALIIWSPGGELDHVVTLVEFVFEVAEIVAQLWFDLVGETLEHNTVGVKVQHAFLEQVERFVEA